MEKKQIAFTYELYNDSNELAEQDLQLLNQARRVTGEAYAPYSQFHVGAAARLTSGEIITGANQENAAYPVTICAERVLLGIAAMLHPHTPIHTLAVSFSSDHRDAAHPISPCGMCRQALLEYEGRMQQPIRIILSGQSGQVYIIETAQQLLPLAFTSSELQSGGEI
jgi:cytidine deaminase